MAGIDRNRVRDAFDRHAAGYDLHAGVQKRVIERLIGLLHELPLSPSPRMVLDIGSGTGMLLKNLSGLYPQARLVGLDLAYGMCLAARANQPESLTLSLLSGDAEALPFRDHAFELVVSTSTFQWLGELDRVFAEAFRALAPGGRFVFAMFGERTLFELRVSYRKAWERSGRGPEGRTHTFPFLSGVGTALDRAGFTGIRVASEREVEFHCSVPELLRSLREIGAGNTATVRSRGLSERRVMVEMMDSYQRDYGADGLIPATYEVIYGEASTPPGARNT
jgi:malonyl-CoA O-methyltransferase